ncbi:MAG: molybdopterin-dependent oxidoreductase [Lachnospiraceae bacterium]
MGIEISKSICRVCSRGCPIDVRLGNDGIQQITPSNPQAGGQLCALGYAYKEYVSRPDRIQSPMRRVGERGSNQWEEITWEEAYREIADHLLGIRAESGADAVAFFTGYTKWYRPVFQRFAYSFGTLNYGTESSTCHESFRMANELNFGSLTRPDIDNSDLFIGWAYNPFYSGNSQGNPLEAFKERGGRVLIIDPKYTPAAKFADIHLRPDPGTDGALALFFGNYLIQNKKIDQDYIDAYVHGFQEYRSNVKQYTLKKTAKITGIPEKTLLAAAELIADSPVFSIQISGAAIPHHTNGMQNCRAILSLLAITGNFDREGGNLLLEYPKDSLNLKVEWDKFVDEVRPLTQDGSGYQNSAAWKWRNPEFRWEGRKQCKPKIGSERFPLWSQVVDQFQSNDLARNILEGTPYPIRAVFALGMNRRMFLNNDRLMEALKKLDFFVDVDIFWTDAAKVADIVLPACTSLERAELVSGGPVVKYVSPAIKPMYQSKSDVDILCELADVMELDDPLLRRGYEAIARNVIMRIGLTFSDLKASGAPMRIPGIEPMIPGRSLQMGLRTPTGKIELYSETIAAIPESYRLDPLPTYRQSLPRKGAAKYPLTLVAGSRISTRFHSRFHGVKSANLFRPVPAAEIHPDDAAELGIRHGDRIAVSTETGTIHVAAHLTKAVKRGTVFMYQSYADAADVNRIIEWNHLDPYSGFPGYRTVRCRVEVQA